MFISILPNYQRLLYMKASSRFEFHGRTSSRITPVLSKILPVFALILIALLCIAIPVGATDAQNSTGNITGVPVGNLTVDNSTPAVSFTSVTTATPTDASLAIIDNTTTTVQEPAYMNESAESSMASPVVTAAPLATSNPRADPIKATSTVTVPDAAFIGKPVSGEAPLTVAFIAATTGSPTGWAWYFGNETYNQTWTQQTAQAPWSNRVEHTSVVMPDGSILVMGGTSDSTGSQNDVWRSTDMGKTWTQQTAHAKWPARYGQTNVVMPDGSIVLMGGKIRAYGQDLNDVWRSTDMGVTWTQQTANAAWHARYAATSAVMPDGSIVLMGGYSDNGYWRDVWRSTDMGKTWTQQTAHANWSIRAGLSNAVMPDGSIVLMGGRIISTRYDDVWRSTDMGVTWTQQTANAAWSSHAAHTSVVMPDGSIMLMGGMANDTNWQNSVWRSTDMGVTWTQQTANAAWHARAGHTSVLMPDGSIVLMGGRISNAFYNDVWRLPTAGSSEQNPSHTYTAPGNYSVALQVSNTGGYSSTLKTGYITVTDSPVSTANVIAFGNTSKITKQPSHTDFSRVGGASAIRRDGSLETFIGGRDLPGNDWVKVTNGAAITQSGELVTWTPGLIATQSVSANAAQSSASNKKYVDIAQFSDGNWLLAIYEDSDGATHLEARGNYADHPEVLGNVPTETGWKMIAAGNNHALALKSNGTLVAWGKNDFGQLNLPTDRKYTDIDAGRDFSIGLTSTSGQESTIVAAGKDDYHQVSGVPAAPDHYIQIAAGTNTAAALTHDSHIAVWGQQLLSTPAPTGAGFTDIQLGPDYGFALQENAPGVQITGPISPGKGVQSREGSGMTIPRGSIFKHTHNDIARVFAPDGTEIFWENDANATQVTLPGESTLATSIIHYVPDKSTVDAKTDYVAKIYSPEGNLLRGSNGDVMTVEEDAWYEESDLSLPYALCFADQGCSAGVAAKQQVFLSRPRSPATSGIPVFSVHQLANNTWVGTVSTLNSTNPEDSHSIVIERKNVDPTEPIFFGIVSGNWSLDKGPSMFVMTKADLTSENAVLEYSGIATASQQLASISLTPQIWKHGVTGDILVYTGDPTSCSDTTACSFDGTFTPVWDISNVTATYFANVTTLYTLPVEMTNGNSDIPSQYATIYDTGDNEPVPEVVVTEPLSPLEPGKLMDAANANNTVLWGGTVEHVMDGGVPTTVVYDKSGQPQFRADDRMAETLLTPGGTSAITTNTIMIPQGTYLNSTAADVVTLKKAPYGKIDTSQENIMTIVYRNHARSSQPKSLLKASDAPSYVEWAGMSRSSMSNFASFKTSWTIPSDPQYEIGPNRKVTINRTQASVWNGIQNDKALIQAVPVFNWYYTGSSDTDLNFDGKWSWAVWGADSTHDLTWLTTPASLSAGDAFWASYSITSTDGSTTHWSIDTSKLDYCLLWDTTELSRTNGELDVALEAYLKAKAGGTSTVWDLKYLPKNTKFTDFEILDTSGNTISPAFTGVVAKTWKDHIPALSVNFASNPYTATLKTEN